MKHLLTFLALLTLSSLALAQRIPLDDPSHVGGSDQLNIGASPNDNTGDTPRAGGTKLKQWAADLNTMLTKSVYSGPAFRADNFNNPAGNVPCVWDSTHDVMPCIQAAHDAAVAAGGGSVQLGFGRFGVSSCYVNQSSGVQLKGQGASSATPQTHLSVLGALTCPVLYTGAPTGGSLVNAGITGIKVECNGLAPIGIEVQHVNYSEFDLGGDSSCTTAGNYLTTNNGPVGSGTQYNKFNLHCNAPAGTSGTCNLLDGALGLWDVSVNRFSIVEGDNDLGDGTVLCYEDNNFFDDITGHVKLGSAWNSGTTYTQGILVKSGGNNYVSTAAGGNINQTPPNVTYWTPTTADTVSTGRGMVKSAGGWWISGAGRYGGAPATDGPQFVGSIAGNTLTVTAVTANMPPLYVKMVVTDLAAVSSASLIAQGTYISALGTGTGGTGTYTLSGPSQTVASETMYGVYGYVPPSGVPCSGGMVPNNADNFRAHVRNTVIQGYSSGMTITPGVGNAGTAKAATVPLTTSARAVYSKTAPVNSLTFTTTVTTPATVAGAMVTGAVAPGTTLPSPTTSGIHLNSPIASVDATHVVLGNTTVDDVPLGTILTIGSAPHPSAVPGNYIIEYSTDTDGGKCPSNDAGHPWCIIAPATPGGTSESGKVAASQTVTFTDFVFMFDNGSLTSHDTWIAYLEYAVTGITTRDSDLFNHSPVPNVGPGSSAAISIRGGPPSYILPDGNTVGFTLFDPTQVLRQLTPASSSAACQAGQFEADTGFLYFCTAKNTWKRIAIATW